MTEIRGKKRRKVVTKEGVMMTGIREKEGKWSPRGCHDDPNPEKRRKVVIINLFKYKL